MTKRTLAACIDRQTGEIDYIVVAFNVAGKEHAAHLFNDGHIEKATEQSKSFLKGVTDDEI